MEFVRTGFAMALALVANATVIGSVDAQQYPTRPIRWIVPVPAGSTTDIVTRLVAQKMNEAWAQQIVVDNRPGGVFTVGSEIVAKAPSDGYTIGTLLTPHVVNPFVLKNLPYNTERDFTPVSLMVIVPGVMSMYSGLGPNTLKEVIALAKAKPGQLNYGSPGPLTSGHLSMELLNLQAGINITHIPYKGGAPAIIDLIGGRIQFMISGPPGVLPHIKAGRLRPIATTAAKRSPGLPDVPTFAESGLPGFDTYEWYGVFAPGRMPKAVLTKLSGEIARIIQLPEMSDKLAVQGAIPVGNSADEFARFVKSEMDQWGKIAQKIGLKPD
ncbi:MAG TPA: tripartite tricarboxylate transporter substrate binding protein [Burkholderiales bacterium]|jgi:tripartite-type tricarboxylate transporter receptor subunit TctC|nr:tripartite tricarboxylate transporter substrate binding protein [Burkholderiales bacterium]